MPGDFRCDRGDYARVFVFFHTRGCGRIERPAFPAPSDFRRRNVFGKPRADRAARSRNCALNQATQKHSSCPGLTRASIDFARAFSKQMDCRVKPGNDILMAFARNTRRDREAVSVGGCCLKIESIVAAITRSASDEILSVVIPGWSEGPDVRCAIAHRGISRFRARCGACHRAALCADPLASPRNDGFWIASRSLSSGALCADLLERNDGLNTPGVSVGYFSKQYRSPPQSLRSRLTPSHASPVS